jgi:hypothetical protein
MSTVYARHGADTTGTTNPSTTDVFKSAQADVNFPAPEPADKVREDEQNERPDAVEAEVETHEHE